METADDINPGSRKQSSNHRTPHGSLSMKNKYEVDALKKISYYIDDVNRSLNSQITGVSSAHTNLAGEGVNVQNITGNKNNKLKAYDNHGINNNDNNNKNSKHRRNIEGQSSGYIITGE